MNKKLQDFINSVMQLNPQCSAEDIADMLWLFQYLPVKKAFSSVSQPEPKYLDLSFSQLKQSKTVLPPRKSKEPPISDNRLSRATTITDTGVVSRSQQKQVPIPIARGLQKALQFTSSLRPLRRLSPSRFDETVDYEKTARRLFDEKIWIPVLQPKLERALTLALVIDDAVSMNLWYTVLRDLRTLLMEQGSFRQCQLWTLHTDAEQARLTAGWR